MLYVTYISIKRKKVYLKGVLCSLIYELLLISQLIILVSFHKLNLLKIIDEFLFTKSKGEFWFSLI